MWKHQTAKHLHELPECNARKGQGKTSFLGCKRGGTTFHQSCWIFNYHLMPNAFAVYSMLLKEEPKLLSSPAPLSRNSGREKADHLKISPANKQSLAT